MFSISLPLYPRLLMTGVSGPVEMWQAAADLARLQHSDHQPLQMLTLAEDKGPVSVFGQIPAYAKFAYSDVTSSDVVMLAPMWGNPIHVVRRQRMLMDWLSAINDSGARIIATGTAVCFLAELGLLDGMPATTHWYYFDQFEKRYPAVELNRHQFITQAGNIYCAGSINALSDLVLFLIRQTYGQHVADIIEQHFSHEISRTFERPFFVKGDHQHHDEDIILAQEWAFAHWNQRFTQKQWSDQTGLSERTFSRRFRQATGMTPLNWLHQVRIDRARGLLRSSNLPIEDVAYQVGFQDSDHFSRLFERLAGLSPSAYRRMVRDKVFRAQVDDSF